MRSKKIQHKRSLFPVKIARYIRKAHCKSIVTKRPSLADLEVSISGGVVKGRILSESFQVEVGAKLEEDTNHSPVTPVASLENLR